MPEIKKQFTGGKMNKDVDERLVPNGEYRDAMNIQVSTSEGSEVGTIQNILGNHSIDGQTFIPYSATCIGSIADEKNDAFYWFTTTAEESAVDALASFTSAQQQPILGVSHIIQHKNNIITPVFTDVSYAIYSMFNSLGHPTYDLAGQTITIITPTVPIIVGMSLTIQDYVGLTTSMPNVVTGVLEGTMLGSVITFQDPLTFLDDLMQPFSMPSMLGTILYFNSSSTFGNTAGEVLGFTKSNLITGINIIDDLLLWTDGSTEPKKINITRSIEGTASTGDKNTLLINHDQGIFDSNDILAREKHITVIKQSPKNALIVEKQTVPDYGYVALPSSMNFLKDVNDPALGNLSVGELVDNQAMDGLFLELDPTVANPMLGDILLFNPVIGNNTPPEEYQVKVKLTQSLNNGNNTLYNSFLTFVNSFLGPLFNFYTADSFQIWRAEIVTISYDTLTVSQDWNWAVQPPEQKTFKNKFPRFSYRWRYQDGEYSTFAPFTNVVFEPKNEFKYDVKEAYNLAMENVITQVKLSGYNQNLPEDVVSIDILYKESNSPVIYVVDTINDVNPLSIVNSFEVTPNQLKAALPSNQLLRAWDNVPRTALAQEVSGSRVIYGNYLQNYNLEEEIVIKANTVDRSICDVNYEKKSLKSIRNYALGVSFLDKYGRQSPVFTDKEGSIDIPIIEAQKQNQLTARVSKGTPGWATHQKFFIKDISNEYYNLAMDRFYDARDGNIWLSFPSSERNKIDDETFLILKKGVEGDVPVVESNKYKILAIENEAPPFIKRRVIPISLARETDIDPFGNGTPSVFVDSTGYPTVGSQKILIDKLYWDAVASPLVDASSVALFEEIELKFSIAVGASGASQSSKPYKVSAMSVDVASGDYVFMLQDSISDDDSWLSNSTNTQPEDTIAVEISRVVVKDSPEFQGRFFVKVAKDPIVNQNIIGQAINSLDTEERTISTLPFHYLADQDGSSGHDTTSTKHQESSTDTFGNWNAVLSPSATSSTPEGFWFIDAAYYHGTYDPVMYGTCVGAFTPSYWQAINIPAAAPPSNDPAMYGAAITTSGFNKGIEPDGNGGAYIYLSYSNLQNAESSGSLHTSSADTDAIWECGNAVSNLAPGPQEEALYEHGIQELGPWDCGNTQHWTLGQPTINSNHATVKQQNQFFQDSRLMFAGGDEIYTIISPYEKIYHVNYTGFQESDDLYTIAHEDQLFNGFTTITYWEAFFDEMYFFGSPNNRRITYKIHLDKDPTDAQYGFNPVDPATGATATELGYIFFIEEDYVNVEDQVVSEFPAIWETEPKKDVDLDIYREIDSTYPLEINNDTNYTFAPKGSTISLSKFGNPLPPSNFINPFNAVVQAWVGNKVILSNPIQLDEYYYSDTANMLITFHRPDGSCVSSTIDGWDDDDLSAVVGYPTWPSGEFLPTNIVINKNVSKQTVSLSWFNCYSFGNGVESQRIRDDYNQITIDKGVKASSTLNELYKEEHRKYGLIYSGLYNSTTGVNNLNQFIAAEKITKDINPTYGSIQKLYSRSSADGDLIALCEDRILKILANKDAVFNADGNPQLIATENVLGQAMPYSGEYGISKNPESFASENYRVYFTDKVRGTVMRLSKDGLTPISSHGMKDWFRDNLKLSTKLIGSHDDRNNEYNINLNSTVLMPTLGQTVSFREDVRGWVSFKSFIPENGVSCANDYYTFQYGKAFMHNSSTQLRNTFYNAGVDSSFTVILNDVPGSIKSFDTINYEGSQARITEFTGAIFNNAVVNDGQYHNLSSVPGWYVDNVKTDQEIGGINEFIEKEGKWFSYMKGVEIAHYEGELNGLPAQRPTINPDGSSTFDQASFAVQGLGVLGGTPIINLTGDCTDPTASNYNPNADWDDGSCIPFVYGCMALSAFNTSEPLANTEDGSCNWYGCIDPGGDMLPSSVTAFGAEALNYENQYPGAILDDGSCILIVYGCLDPLNSNYNPDANMNAEGGSAEACIPIVWGCLEEEGVNYYAGAAYDNGLCSMPGCVLYPNASNYQYSTVTGALFSSSALNYVVFDPLDPTAGVYDDGSCIIPGCTDFGGLTETEWIALGYPTANTTQVYTGNPAGNYSSNATTDNGSCLYCSDTTANNDDASGGSSNMTEGCQYCMLEGWAQYSISGNITTGELTIVVTAENGLGNIPQPALVDSIAFTITDYTTYPAGFPLLLGFDQQDVEYDPTTFTWTVVIPSLDLYNPININVIGECSNTDSQTLSFTTTAFGVPTPGCTELYACNFNISATSDDGTCEYYSCSGCTDPLAISSSYNKQNTGPNAGLPCVGATGCTTACGNGIIAGAGVPPDGCCDYDIMGCMDVNYDNYNPLATVSDGSCIMYVYGCTNQAYTQYDPLANVDDGSCATLIDYGCIDDRACNYLYNQNGIHIPTMDHDCTMTQNGTVHTCCAYGFDDVYVGGTAGQSGSIPYESTGATLASDLELERTKHYIDGNSFPPDINIGLSFDHSLGNSLIDQFWANMWERNDDDTGWDWIAQYVRVNAGSYLTNSGGTWNDAPFKEGSNTFQWTNTAADDTDTDNYDHKPYNAIGGIRKYLVRMGQKVNGISYGYTVLPTYGSTNIPGCGVSLVFNFEPTGCMTPDIFGGAHANPILGCLDFDACNNDCAVDANGNATAPSTGTNCGDQVTCHDQNLCTMPPDTATCVTTTTNQGQTHTCVADACFIVSPGPYVGTLISSAVSICQNTALDPSDGYANKCNLATQ